MILWVWLLRCLLGLLWCGIMWLFYLLIVVFFSFAYMCFVWYCCDCVSVPGLWAGGWLFT